MPEQIRSGKVTTPRTKKQRILAQTIESLGFHSNTRNRIVDFVLGHKFPAQATDIDRQETMARNWHKLKRLAGECTVQDYIEVYDSLDGSSRFWARRSIKHKHMRDKLVVLGLTKLDWIALPTKTVTIAMLKRVGKVKLLDRSVLLLGTLSSKALERLCSHTGKKAEEVSIRELLGIHEDNTSFWRWGDYTRSLANTRERLYEIGFQYGDGPFMQGATKRELVEKLMQQHSLNRKTATLVADIAHRRGWVKAFRE